MRLISCEATNFASYDSVELNFESGLTLIYGKTGSGKSTIPDLPCWIMFGITAKDGNADDVRSWKNSDADTHGVLEVELTNETITIFRTRGKSNDLCWTEAQDLEYAIRGKDLTETQRLLEKRLGITADVYLSSAYYCEFSPSSTFFTAAAKSRRALFENLAPLDLPIRLSEKTTEARRQAKRDHERLRLGMADLSGRYEQLLSSLEGTKRRSEQWEQKQAQSIHSSRRKCEDFEKDKDAKIKALETKAYTWQKNKETQIDSILAAMEEITPAIDPQHYMSKRMTRLRLEAHELSKQTCKTCGGPSVGKEYADIMKEIDRCSKVATENKELIAILDHNKAQLAQVQDSENPFTQQIDAITLSVNHYAEQIDVAVKEANPYEEQLTQLETDLTQASEELERLNKEIKELESKICALSQLYDLSYTLRGELLKRAVFEIEAATNTYIEKYFEGEIRVAFELEGTDTLKISITKNGYDCSFKQLSKGQRQILRLCFSIAIMKASANKVGVKFSNLFFDEACDGMDSNLKVRAYGLFEELSTECDSIAIIEHDQGFQNLFTNKWHITMIDDASTIEQEHG